MKTLLLLCLLAMLPVWALVSAEPPAVPGPNATKAEWTAYDNAVSAWNQKTEAEKQAAVVAAQQQKALLQAEYRAILARKQAEQAARAAALRAEQRQQLLLQAKIDRLRR